MHPTIKLPEQILDVEEYKLLSPNDKSLYMEKTLGKILDNNVDTGVSIPLILENIYFNH